MTARTKTQYNLDKAMFHLLQLYSQTGYIPDMRHINNAREPLAAANGNGAAAPAYDKTRSQLRRAHERLDALAAHLGEHLNKFPRGAYLEPEQNRDLIVLQHEGAFNVGVVTAVTATRWRVWVYKTQSEVYIDPERSRYVLIPVTAEDWSAGDE